MSDLTVVGTKMAEDQMCNVISATRMNPEVMPDK